MIEAITTAGAGTGLAEFANPIAAAYEGASLAQLGKPSALANVFTSNLQTPLGNRLAQIVQQKDAGDIAGARTNLIQVWGKFLNDSDDFLKHHLDQGIVVYQALSTQSLLQTVDTLSRQVGFVNGLEDLNTNIVGSIGTADPTHPPFSFLIWFPQLLKTLPGLVQTIRGATGNGPVTADTGPNVLPGSIAPKSNLWILLLLLALILILLLAVPRLVR